MKFVWEYLNLEHGWQWLRLDFKAIKRGRNKALTYVSKHKDRVADRTKKDDEQKEKRRGERKEQTGSEGKEEGTSVSDDEHSWLSRIRRRKLKAEPQQYCFC